MTSLKIGAIAKATRANFLPASILPFLIGAFYARWCGYALSIWMFVLGVIAAGAMHLAGNLFNNYFDYLSGADGVEENISPFFGGSRVIQDGLFSSNAILKLGISFAVLSIICVVGLSIMAGNPIFTILAIGIGLLAFEYTAPPFKFAYNMLGELIIFLLFGVFIVAGSFYLFTGHITWQAIIVSLPISFLAAAIIICNEIPDYETDIKSGKYNLIKLVTYDKGYQLYAAVVSLSLLSIIINILSGTLSWIGLIIIPLYLIGFKTIQILRYAKRDDTKKFINASKLTIILHSLVGISMAIIYLVKV